MLLFGFSDKSFHIFVTGFASLFTAVEGRKINYTEAVLSVAGFSNLVGNLCLLILYVNLIAYNGDVEAQSALRLTQDCQGYLCAFLAADQADGIAQVHVDDVNGLSAFLCHGYDFVLWIQQTRSLGASSGN